jgi:hypothetical protein
MNAREAMPMASQQDWPELRYAAWKDTYAALHLWTQIVGKVRLALTPWLNHSWHVTLAVTPRGLATPLISTATHDLDIEFDLVEHVLKLRTGAGHVRQVVLRPVPVAEFYAELLHALSGLGIETRIDPMPNELADAVPFDKDVRPGAYDREYADRFRRVLLRAHEVLFAFRTAFLGKASPVHFFWGGFDLAVTRFSGRRAPPHPGGIPHLSDTVTRESYSHEVSSAGFWPGSAPILEPAFYSYAYPQPVGFASAKVQPAEAYFSRELGEFILPYEAVRTARDPRQMLMDFLQSTYVAAAENGKWDRAALECPLGVPRLPRPV